jgi:histidinol-phosphate aminotransferase
VGCAAALDDQKHVEQVIALTREGRTYFETELAKLKVNFVPSQANFVMFETKWDSHIIYQSLLRRGIILRPLKNYGLRNHLRMSVGTMEENKSAIRALTEVLRDLARGSVVQGES